MPEKAWFVRLAFNGLLGYQECYQVGNHHFLQEQEELRHFVMGKCSGLRMTQYKPTEALFGTCDFYDFS